MRTESDCLACFLQQALATARLAGAGPAVQEQVVAEVARLLPELDRALSPPENAVRVYGRIAEITGVADPFASAKADSNRFAMELQEQIRARICAASDPLAAAVRYAMAANVIDYGTQRSFDALQALEACLEEPPVLDGYAQFCAVVGAGGGRSILYLADNCGEIVFDGLLIEQLQALGCRVTLAVRGETILNDATLEDARSCGLDRLCPVIGNGTGCPGTPLACCSDEFCDALARADLIISKGQGNYESLAGAAVPVFYLLTVKCSVVAARIAAEQGVPAGQITGRGEMVLMEGKGEACCRNRLRNS